MVSYMKERKLIILQQKTKLELYICNKEIMATEIKNKMKKILKNTISSISKNKINMMKITIIKIRLELTEKYLMKQ